MFCVAVPSSPLNLQRCNNSLSVSTNLTILNICWEKPNGGNAILDYFVLWRSESNQMSKSDTVEHVSEEVHYLFVIDELLKGEKVNVTVISRNSAGISQADILNVATGA